MTVDNFKNARSWKSTVISEDSGLELTRKGELCGLLAS